MPTKAILGCLDGQKESYPSRKQADAVIRQRIAALRVQGIYHIRLRRYRCPLGIHGWHLSSGPRRFGV